MKAFFLLLFLSVVWMTAPLTGQSCGCTNCPEPMPDGFTGDFFLQVSGANNDDLADTAQGVCGVRLFFEHTYLSDLEITLTSPGGQTITLLGPVGLFGATNNSQWDVTFLPCSSTAMPDPGQTATWDNFGYTSNTAYNGTYYPFAGCLEDFNAGPVNGTWTLTVTDGQPQDEGVFLGYDILFCDSSGIRCLNCQSVESVLTDSLPVQACQGDSNLLLSPAPFWQQTAPDSNQYAYTYLIGQTGQSVTQQSQPDLGSFPPGTYTVQGLYYWLPDSSLLTQSLDSLPLDSLLQAANNGQLPFCGTFSENAISVEVLSIDSSLIQQTLCPGDSFEYANVVYSQPDTFWVTLTATTGCDSLVRIELNGVPPAVDTLPEAICQGDTLELAGQLFFQTGTYPVLLPNATSTGCDSLVVLQLTVLNPAVMILPPDTLSCGQTQVDLQAQYGPAGVSPTYQWFSLSGNGLLSGVDSSTATVNAPGQYGLATSLTGPGGLFCTDTQWVEVVSIGQIVVADIIPPTPLTCAQSSLVLNGTNSTQGPSLEYLWTDNTGVSLGTGMLLNVNQPGTYRLIVEDTLSECADTTTVQVPIDTTAPAAQAQSSGNISCLDTVVWLSTGPQTGQTFRWLELNGAFLSDSFALQTGTPASYVLEVTDSMNGCTARDTVGVTDIRRWPLADAGPDQTLTCISDTLFIMAITDSISSGQWESKGQVVSTDANLVLTQTGHYLWKATDTLSGCSTLDTLEVDADTLPPNVQILPPDTFFCGIDQIVLSTFTTDSSDLQYAWTNQGGNLLGNGTNLLISQPGSYQLQVTDSLSGCFVLDTVQVMADTSLPMAQIVPPDTFFCNTSQVQLSAVLPDTQGLLLVWQDTFGNPLGNSTQLTIWQPGISLFTITDTTNGCARSYIVRVPKDTSSPVIPPILPDTFTCLQDSVVLTADPSLSGFLLSWVSPQGDTLSNDGQLIAQQPGSYQFIVENPANGCTAQRPVFLPIDTLSPTGTIAWDQALSCENDSVRLYLQNASGTPLIRWLSEGVVLDSGTTEVWVQTAGPFELELTAPGNGCQWSDTFTIPADTAAPQVLLMVDDTIDCQTGEVTIVSQVFPAGIDVSYTWVGPSGSLPDTTPAISVTDPGIFQLWVENRDNGCTSQAETEVLASLTPPIALATVEDTLTCNQQTVTLFSIGSSSGPGIVYSWRDTDAVALGQADTLEVNEPGEYLLSVENTQNGCIAEAWVTVIQDTVAPSLQIPSAPFELNCIDTLLSLNAAPWVSTGLNGLAFQWRDVMGTVLGSDPVLTLHEEGLYFLQVTHVQNGCRTTENFLVVDNSDLPAAFIATADTLTCEQTTVVLDASASSSMGPFTYQWTGPGLLSPTSVLLPEVNQPGQYQLRVTDTTSGCWQTATITVGQDTAAPIPVLVLSGELGCGGGVLTLDASNSQAGGDLGWQWSASQGGTIDGPSNLPTLQVVSSGMYQVLITDIENGCSADTSLLVPMFSEGITGLTGMIEPVRCAGEANGSFQIEQVMGTTASPFIYYWNGNGPFLQDEWTGLSAGTYSLQVRDTNGCTFDTLITLNDPPPLSLFVGQDQAIDVGESVFISPQTNGVVQESEWLAPAQAPVQTGVFTWEAMPQQTQRYRLRITDMNGCTAEDEMQIIVEVVRNLFAPNVFSPNDDGYNDWFSPIAGEGVEQIRICQIYNRWGALVFERRNYLPRSPDPSQAWDGRFNEEPCPPDVYPFYIEVVYTDGAVEIVSGSVTLVR